MTRILAFDVGIKNLAYCITNYEDQKYKIEHWGLINLDDDRKNCTFITRTKKECGKVACMEYQDKENKTQYYCKTHQVKYMPTEIQIEKIDTKTKKICEYIEENNTCTKKASCILTHNDTTHNYCTQHSNKQQKVLNKKTKMAKHNSNKLPIFDLTVKLCNKLDFIKDIISNKQINEIIIENQPSLLNPTMKTISSVIYTYFIINGIIQNKTNKVENIKFVAPSNKLKINKEKSSEIIKIAKNKKEEYDYTKELSIRYCKELISDDKTNLELLNKSVKQDDLCDAFLHGFYYKLCQKKTPDEFVNKLTQVVDTYKKDIIEIQKKKLKKSIKIDI